MHSCRTLTFAKSEHLNGHWSRTTTEPQRCSVKYTRRQEDEEVDRIGAVCRELGNQPNVRATGSFGLLSHRVTWSLSVESHSPTGNGPPALPARSFLACVSFMWTKTSRDHCTCSTTLPQSHPCSWQKQNSSAMKQHIIMNSHEDVTTNPDRHSRNRQIWGLVMVVFQNLLKDVIKEKEK